MKQSVSAKIYVLKILIYFCFTMCQHVFKHFFFSKLYSNVGPCLILFQPKFKLITLTTVYEIYIFLHKYFIFSEEYILEEKLAQDKQKKNFKVFEISSSNLIESGHLGLPYKLLLIVMFINYLNTLSEILPLS